MKGIPNNVIPQNLRIMINYELYSLRDVQNCFALFRITPTKNYYIKPDEKCKKIELSDDIILNFLGIQNYLCVSYA